MYLEKLSPEFFQEAVTSENLSGAIERALDDVARRENLQREFLQVHESLRAGGAARAAEARASIPMMEIGHQLEQLRIRGDYMYELNSPI